MRNLQTIFNNYQNIVKTLWSKTYCACSKLLYENKIIQAFSIFTLIAILTITIFINSDKSINYRIAFSAFYILSVIACLRYKSKNIYLYKYWKGVKIPLLCFLFFYYTILFIMFFAYQFVVTFLICFFTFYFGIKYSFPFLLDKEINNDLVMYLSITSSFIFVTLKSSEETFNKGLEKTKHKLEEDIKKRSLQAKKKKGIVKIILKISLLQNLIIYNLSPIYSSNHIRYIIYFSYFSLLVFSNTHQYFSTEYLSHDFTNNSISGSLLTYLAFDNLYKDRNIMKDITPTNILKKVMDTIRKSINIVSEKE